ncbi:hypothetical protein D3C79_754860 [compost metagenome]
MSLRSPASIGLKARELVGKRILANGSATLPMTSKPLNRPVTTGHGCFAPIRSVDHAATSAWPILRKHSST